MSINNFDVKPDTHYKVEAYGPVALAEVEQLLAKEKPFAWRRVLEYCKNFMTVQRAGVPCIPVVPLLGLFRSAPKSLYELAYAQPLWVSEFDNLVVTTGLTDLIDKYFKGSSYTAAHYVGLLSSTPTVAAGDTMASHGGWTEVTDYSQANRVTPTWGTPSAGSVNNSASKAVFSINATVTVGGAFLTTNNTKGGSTGTLYGGGAFSEGNRALINGDTLNVQVTATATG
jgi:hypothetical protein